VLACARSQALQFLQFAGAEAECDESRRFP
jgi:hypothetical protein